MPSTHQNFSDFMAVRNGSLLAPLAAALTAGVLPGSEVSGECTDNQTGTAYAGEIDWNDLFFGVPVTPFVDSESSATDANPFPSSAGVSAALAGLSTGASRGESARDKLMPYVLQYNLLEAYQRSQLSRKQRRQQFIQHAQFMASQHGLSDAEINQLVLLERLGQKGVGTAT